MFYYFSININVKILKKDTPGILNTRSVSPTVTSSRKLKIALSELTYIPKPIYSIIGVSFAVSLYSSLYSIISFSVPYFPLYSIIFFSVPLYFPLYSILFFPIIFPSLFHYFLFWPIIFHSPFHYISPSLSQICIGSLAPYSLFKMNQPRFEPSRVCTQCHGSSFTIFDITWPITLVGHLGNTGTLLKSSIFNETNEDTNIHTGLILTVQVDSDRFGKTTISIAHFQSQ